MAKILVTGGPVHAKLDAVKIVTNRFKGRRIMTLALLLAKKGHDVIYLGPKHGIPVPAEEGMALTNVGHDGFLDYMEMVEHLSRGVDMAILGAAVANLIPEPPWGVDQKFPSHDYREGDKVMVPFRVAPRVINEVKHANPRCTLVGFKLLSGVSDDELVRAAYTIVQDAKADLVVANDSTNLDRKLLVTKERSVIEMTETWLTDFLHEMAEDKHYTTVWRGSGVPGVPDATDSYFAVMREHGSRIEEFGTVGDHVFGCAAVRVRGGGFLCSPRGKNTIHEDPVYVHEVHHGVRHVVVGQSAYLDTEEYPKASLNAPLLARIFDSDPLIKAIVHTHQTDTGLSVLPYAPPGTVRDSHRKLLYEDFEIEHHGTFTRIMEGS
jgi:hypothetical protein